MVGLAAHLGEVQNGAGMLTDLKPHKPFLLADFIKSDGDRVFDVPRTIA
jgi:hypothetical protein